MIRAEKTERRLTVAHLVGLILLLLIVAACTQSPSHNIPPGLGAPSIQPDNTVVRIEGGTIEGTVSRKVLSFKGVPFAAPPTGPYRWRAPQPVIPWTGVRKAAMFGHDCMQAIETSAATTPNSSPSEDCLVLNVWRPAHQEPGERLPVLVWIHGGAYVNGGTSTPLYDGSAFARQGLIVVSINYRLGRFGFFAHPALISANEGPIGNFGYMDQIAALRWVQRNIAAFAGDSHQVTLIGESAGGDSVMHLLTSPQTTGLFQRAIVMSGHGRMHALGGYTLSGGTPQKPSADQIGVNFAKSLGIIDTGPRALSALRDLPADKICGDLSTSWLLRSTLGPPTYAKGAIVDGSIVITSPEEMLRRKKANKVPLMIGTTSQDLSPAVPPSAKDPLAYFGLNTKQARALYKADGLLMPNDMYAAAGADMTMHEPARFVAHQMTQAGMPVWLYRFSYVADSLRPKIRGAAHASELPFVFGTLLARYGEAVTERDRRTESSVNAYFANFAKHGDPNGAGLPTWPTFDPGRSDLMMFTMDNGPVIIPDPLKERLDLVEQAAKAWR
ncbi:carboxylesterase/lipase family protein [Nitrospira lenta]|nr:carboxylesterase family protein [Nitrospira lenta]